MKTVATIFAATTLLAAAPAAVQAKDYVHTQCSASDYRVSLTDLFLGAITATEVSIEGEGRAICADGIATAINESGSQVLLEIEDGQLICIQSGKEERLAAARATRELYYVRGTFSDVRNGSIILNDCSLQHYSTI